MRTLARVLRRRRYTYELWTKHGILQSKYRAQNLDHIDQYTAEEDDKEWGTTGARSRPDTLLKRHTLARARGGGYTAATQATVAQLAVHAIKMASDSRKTTLTGPVKRKMIQLWFTHWEQLDP